AVAGGYLGGKAVDTGMKIATGKTWAENVKERLGLHSNTLAEITNPGTWIGGGLPFASRGSRILLSAGDPLARDPTIYNL
ncbi:MAG: hypothetical protein IKI60_04330, partial [Alloprevotella sp.]|nr:hypothetical protein [Alloprevotella sp.]